MPAGIVVNGASFPQRVTGVQRYARELTSRLLNEGDVRLLLPGPAPDFAPPTGSRVEVVASPRWVAPAGAWGWLNTALPRALYPGDVLWSPSIRAPLFAPRHVLTIHDLSPLDHPEWFSKAVVAQWRLLLPLLVKRCEHFVTDSEFSRDRLISRLGVDGSRASVIPCGADPRFGAATPEQISAVRTTHDLPDRFILALGSVDPRKNIRLLLDAYRRSEVGPTVGMVLVGGQSRNFAKDRAMDGPLPDGARHLGFVDDAELPALYAAAEVFAFPSLYEGFGLPPLEAMAAGTPVIALSSTEAVVETVGQAGVLVAPTAQELAATLVRVLDDPGLRARLSRAGRRRAAAFTWESAADQLRRLLDSLA